MRNLQRSICLCILLIAACFAKAQTITITKPNGGEVLYPCQSYTITWTQTGTPSNYWNIDYSIDGGTIWASVATNYLATNGQFAWTVPNVTTTTALIRVYDAQNPATTDRSDAVFSIQKAVTLTSPNGGEIITGNTVYNITWDAIANGTSTFSLYYSLNNGSSWTTIVNNYDASSRSYAWSVPVIALNTNCLIRVGYFAQSCTQDLSDAAFTITPPTPALTYPNGGQTLQPGCTLNISWLTTTLYTTARLDYSVDGGTSWNLITDNATNNGSYSWTIPLSLASSSNCLIRICNTNNVNLFDVSNAPFSIGVPITVTAFNNGGTAVGCSTAVISFTKTPCIGNWYVYYSTDNGATYTMFTSLIDNGGTSQTFNWNVPNGINSTTAKIKIESRNNPGVFDESDGNFTIVSSNDITVTSPNGGETLPALTTQTITWTNLPSASGQYNIYYSINGTNWNNIASNVTGNSYAWAVPNINAPSCLIRVEDYINTCKYDVSNATFAVTPATPLLTSPNGGQTWQLGCSYNITWLTSTLYTTAKIDYSTDNGTTWTQIVSGASNSGSYAWTVPTTITPSTQCLIRISNTGYLALNDVSNAPFTIAVPVTVNSFNTGGTAVGCSSVSISFTKSPCLGNSWYVYYSTDNGNNYSYVGYVTENGSATQTFTWQVPNGVSTTTAKVKVTSFNTPSATDESEGNFTISPSNDITVTSPNGGETLTGNSIHPITWTNLPTASGQYTIQYSINGTSWNLIASNITGNTYNWTVPNINAPSCRIRVEDYLNNCKYDVSDATFSISPVQPVLIYPNGGQTWQLGCSYTINWSTSTLYTTAKIDYSTDNGTTWTQIVNAATNNGSYAWTVPTTLTPSTQCLIRISNTGNLALNDVSNATFTIAPPVTVTSFNNGGTAIGCSSAAVSFTKSPCLGSTWYVYYSTNNGNNYSYVGYATDNGASTQTYTWQVPNEVNSTTAKIKVTNFNTPSATDESEGNFTIIPSNDITVTSPNGGETLTGNSTHPITWTNLPTASGQYTIQYSTNGTSWNLIAYNITGNTYNWTVPNINAPSCRIRVEDYLNNCKYDLSDATFSISPVQPALIYPNGGQTWQLGCSYNITWLTSTLYTTAKIDYSTDNGTTWTQIVNAATNNGSYAWTVPATLTPSTQCLIRISNTGNLALNDVSNAPFTIAAPVTVNSFNTGGTAVGCSSVSISFTKSPCLGTSWYVYYSTDNGNNYSYVGYVTENGSATQTFTWQVPNGVSTTTAKVKVTNFNVPSATDESEGNFTIIPSNDITLTSPNGGEVLTALTPYTITWTNLPGASGQYSLSYTSNGVNYNTIASNITGNSYVWTPANAAAVSSYRIRVTDYVNNCKYDESDATFTINPATPVLYSPNGAQTWQQGCAYNITWNTATLYTTARIDYTLDGGTTWTNIATSASNNGSYSWTVPVGITISSNCLIRISNTGNLALNDVSNAPFSIGVPLTVNSFNTGGSVIGCNTVPISFTKSPCIGNTWYFWYSANNGTNWSFIGSATENGSISQTYNWQVPNGINTTNAKVRVSSNNPIGIEDESEGNFTISSSNDITLTSPNGGEIWQGRSTKAITWTNLAGASGQYTIYYSVNNGSSWNIIANNITGNTYNWTVPNLSSTQCLVRVTDYVNNCKLDDSNAPFSIVPAIPVLTAPNGGQSWYAGTVNNITWNSSTIYTSSVRLDYSVDNGTNWINIVSGATNNGSYSWTVPLENSANSLVRIMNFNDVSVSDQSDAVFTIKPAVTILTPNGGEQVNNIGGCTVTSITFDHSPAFTTFYLEYSLNDGATWNPITTNFSATANPATYNWNVPNRSSAQARVRVRPTANSYYDASDDIFPIKKAVTLIQPNFGGIMQAGSSYEISWSSDGISSVYDLFYTTNGTTYTNIVTGYNTSNNKYTWTVPNIPSTNCRIMIRDNINTCKTDTSDMAFIISTTAAPITLVKPNGIADTVNACGQYNITWTETSAIGNYNIDYSLNGGTSWVNIVSNYATNSGSYAWAVPAGIASNQALIRISAAANATINDWSNAYFVIAQPTYTFTGNGNWSDAANWANGQVPPANPPTCTQIIIDNLPGGECIMNVPYTLPAGASFTVKPGKKLTIAGNLNIQ